MQLPLDLSDLEATLVALVRRITATDTMRFDVLRGRELFDAKLSHGESLASGVRVRGKARPAVDGQREGRGRFLPRPLRWDTWATLVMTTLALVIGWGIIRYSPERSLGRPLVYTTANGQRATVTLPDGNTVALNVASQLEVPANYARGNHVVRVSGEGLFTVTHHERTPFTVVAGGTVTRVLGTSFVVRHYATDRTTTVAVRDGKVMVQSLVLTAARQVVFGPSGMKAVQPADPSQFSFATGVLTFRDVPLSDAIVELDRWYDADIRLGDPTLKTRRVTGGNLPGSLSDLKTILEMTFNVRVVRDGRVLTLFSR